MKSLLPFIVLAVSGYAQATTYSKTSSFIGESFLNAFTWETSTDPNHGRVVYVDKATAAKDGLYEVTKHSVTLRTDDTTVLDPNGPGRNAIRLLSTNQYSEHVIVFDIAHMPVGCGTWPMIIGANWPTHGEIDILDGVNNQAFNQANFQTGPTCFMPHSRPMTGVSTQDNCTSAPYDNYNGCGVRFSDNRSFGPRFNRAGGGWFVMERNATGVSVWVWERHSAPADIKHAAHTINPATWGLPGAYFPNNPQCDFSQHLGPMNVIIALTFCGDYATPSYTQDGCPSTCVDFVNNNPKAFSGAYFEFNAMNVYE